VLLRRLYEDELAQASYLVGCQATGEAIVVDPNRDVDQYLAAAEEEGLDIVAATETHIHADYLSGVRELGHRTGARMLLPGEGGEGWEYGFVDEGRVGLLKEGDTFEVGRIRFRVYHTPGHTPEHISLAVTDGAAASEPMGVFTGDFIFVGDVGRPDLLEKAAGVAGAMDEGARQLFRSLSRFRELPDHLQIWPGHGAGSACGRALGAVPQSTLGYEKRVSWAFQYDDEDAFVEAVLAGQPEVPRYFRRMKELNRDGPPLLGARPRPELLDPDRLAPLLEGGGIVVDLRPRRAYAAGHVPGTISIPPETSFANWGGWLLPDDRDLYLLAPSGGAILDDRVRTLSLIGLDRIGGWFDESALDAWAASEGSLEEADAVGPEEAEPLVGEAAVTVVDVRGRAEWDGGHLPGARHIHLGELEERSDELNRDQPVLLYCRSGVRSGIGQSLLQARGFGRTVNLEGGYVAWNRAGGRVVRDEPADTEAPARTP